MSLWVLVGGISRSDIEMWVGMKEMYWVLVRWVRPLKMRVETVQNRDG